MDGRLWIKPLFHSITSTATATATSITNQNRIFHQSRLHQRPRQGRLTVRSSLSLFTILVIIIGTRTTVPTTSIARVRTASAFVFDTAFTGRSTTTTTTTTSWRSHNNNKRFISCRYFHNQRRSRSFGLMGSIFSSSRRTSIITNPSTPPTAVGTTVDDTSSTTMFRRTSPRFQAAVSSSSPLRVTPVSNEETDGDDDDTNNNVTTPTTTATTPTTKRRRPSRNSSSSSTTPVEVTPDVKAKKRTAKKRKTTATATTTITSADSGSTKPPLPPHVGTGKPPAGWEEIYTLVQELRSDRTAPCDFEGGEALPEPGLVDTDLKTHRFQILVALMLSSQTKDAIVGQAMRDLQSHGLTVDNLLRTSHDDLNRLIQKVGFHNNKTKYLKQVVQILRDDYNDDIPPTAAEMIDKLPGVGPKMAYIIENAAWGVCSGIGVDTHMHRIFNQLKWVKPKTGTGPTKTPEQTRLSLESWLPHEYWSDVNLLWVGFGQESTQQKSKMLRKAVECSRPRDAVKLLRRLGMKIQQEAAKMDRQEAEEKQNGKTTEDDVDSDHTLSWSDRVEEALKG